MASYAVIFDAQSCFKNRADICKTYLFSTNKLLLKKLHFKRALKAIQRCSVKKVFLKISQNSQENSCARAFFLRKLQVCNFIKK